MNILCQPTRYSTEVLCNGTTYCKLIKEDEVRCNTERYLVGEGPLTYEDKTFWIYLGIYVALVLFAGK